MQGKPTPDIFAEKALDKSRDTHLIRRIYPFVVPYRHLLIVAILLMVVITGLELSIPYVTKTAIDNYIVPTKTASKTAGNADRPAHRFSVDTSDPAVAKIVKRHPALFTRGASGTRISSTNLKKLPSNAVAKIRKNDIRGVARAALLLIVIVLFNFGMNFAQVMLMEYTGQKIMHDLRMRLFDHILHLSIHFFTKNPVGRLVTRATNDIQNMHEMLTSVLIFILNDLFMVTGITIVLFVMNWRLSLVVYATFPIVFYAAYRFAGHARAAYRILRIKVAEINTKFSETIGGVHIIQSFNQERNNYRKFSRINHENFTAGMQQITVFALFMPFIELMSSVALAIVIFYGGRRILANALTLGDLVVFISYIKMFFRPIRDIAEKYNITQDAMSSAERIFLILDESDRLTTADLPAPAPMPAHISELAVEDVRFYYVPDEPVLKNISFTVKAGETVAVVGQTGAGKTSLINLIMRFYDPDTGNIRMNGTDIRKFDVNDLRSRLALVNQDPFLFSGSLRNNIFPRNQNPTPEEIDRILSQAYCKSFIERLPGGLDAQMHEQGATLSSGQRQLVSIARALARDPDLIIFDEATSYIDSETEARIQEALANLMRDRTAIVIAHRLSTARFADRIIVLHNGKIIETGSHLHLIENKGFYFRLIQLQNGPL